MRTPAPALHPPAITRLRASPPPYSATRSLTVGRGLLYDVLSTHDRLTWAQIQKCARIPSSRRRCIVASAASTLIDSGTGPQPISMPSK